jgi:hypothetical protein
VSEFVRQKDTEQCNGERQSVEQHSWIAPDSGVQGKNVFEMEGEVAIEIKLHRRADYGRGEKCRDKEKTVNPIALARVGGRETMGFRRTVLGVEGIRPRRKIL